MFVAIEPLLESLHGDAALAPPRTLPHFAGTLTETTAELAASEHPIKQLAENRLAKKRFLFSALLIHENLLSSVAIEIALTIVVVPERAEYGPSMWMLEGVLRAGFPP